MSAQAPKFGYWVLDYIESGEKNSVKFDNSSIRFVDDYMYQLLSMKHLTISEYSVYYVSSTGQKTPLEGFLIRKWNHVLKFLKCEYDKVNSVNVEEEITP
ncbi:MAG: hypothetical protein EB127_30335 [Alphaproteobacteria bacterium]|nr:hypothetical protein [Alphaproteobacteria bacterium]